MSIRRFGLILAVALLLGGLGGEAWAQSGGMPTGGSASKVEWTTDVKPDTVRPGTPVTVHFDAAIEPDWKMYALDAPPPTRAVEVRFKDLPAGWTARSPEQQTPETGFDPNFQKNVTWFAESAHLWADVTVPKGAAAGTHDLRGALTFMVCSKTMCLPPTQVDFSETVTVVEAGARRVEESTTGTESAADSPESAVGDTLESAAGDEDAGTGSAEAVPSEAETESAATDGAGMDGAGAEESGAEESGAASAELDRVRASGLIGFLLLAIGAGAAALLTPCVFPMIPLTVSFFTRHAESRSGAVRAALLYGVAIVATFTGLGVAMSLLVGAAGAQSVAANPWVNAFIGVVFVVFALSLLGLFELRLPGGLVNFFNRQGTERGGVPGILFMGLTLTLVSFSCTAPFVGGLLAATAGGEWFYPVAGMAAFSTTFALPFVGFALFPNALDRLPTSGNWMNVVKVTLGFIELAAALKFLSNADLIWGTGLLSRPLAIALTIVIFAVAGVYLLGKVRLHHEAPVESIGSLRLVTAMVFFGTALYMLPGLFGAPLGAIDAYLPPRQVTDATLYTAARGAGGEATESELPWHTDDVEAAFAEAKRTGQPLFIDFTGYTCTNCRDMEANVFPRPPVAEQFREHFVLLRLYTDDLPKGTEYQRYQLRLTGTTALPTYAIVDPEDRSLVRKVSGVHSAEAFAGFLQDGRAAFRDQRLAVR